MSVQAGIWNFDGKPVDRNLIADLHASLKKQGPDGESHWVDGSIALLYRPFHTTKESRRETQPYISRRGFILTWDGRLDNRDELALEFRSYVESDPTDVALIAAAFDHWDIHCFSRITGDWAVSVWKPQQRELLFGVDYMAIRHIFYYLKNKSIWWSSDLSPLVLLSGDTFDIDDDYIAGYFANDPESHLTPYRGIREVPSGHFACVRDSNVSVERYWTFSPASRIRYKTDSQYEETFRHLFQQSVRRRSNTYVYCWFLRFGVVWVRRFLGGQLSPASIGAVLRDAQEQIQARREQRLCSGTYRALAVDGIYLRYRRSAESQARKGVLLVAVGVREGGGFEVLEWMAAAAETSQAYEELFTRLWRRGLEQVELVISDGAEGAASAAALVYPAAAHQLCLAHWFRNLEGLTPPLQWWQRKKVPAGILVDL